MMAELLVFPKGPLVPSQSAVTLKVRRKGKVLRMKQKSELLNTEQVARRLGYSARTITDWAQQYQDSGGLEGIPSFKLGRGWRFDESALEEWICEKQNHKKKATA